MRLALLTIGVIALLAAVISAQAPKSIQAPPDLLRPPADATKTKSGLVSKVMAAGTGQTRPASDALVTMQYTGWTSDGKMIDSTKIDGKPRTFPLSGVIAGLIEGVQLMVPGETRRFWIPPALGYKDPAHPRKGEVVFDVELISFIPVPQDVSAPPADAKKTSSGLAYKVLKAGTGVRRPSASSTVTVNYSGWTTDGRLFDSSYLHGEPISFQLNRVIPGWTEGVALMMEGETTRFWIPEDLAYKGQPGQPKGMLVFDVELTKIQ
jgi:FKBP-type peptidyl-prolyl cis-trans isomerase